MIKIIMPRKGVSVDLFDFDWLDLLDIADCDSFNALILPIYLYLSTYLRGLYFAGPNLMPAPLNAGPYYHDFNRNRR